MGPEYPGEKLENPFGTKEQKAQPDPIVDSLTENLIESTQQQSSPSDLLADNDSLLDFDMDIPDMDALSDDSVEFQEIQDESKGSLRFGILGLGQGGGRVAEAFYRMGYKKCLALNTASHDLEFLRIEHKLQIGGGVEGAGKNMDAAAQVFNQNRAEILIRMREVFGEELDGILVCAGAGGGTGSGTILPAVELARVYMKRLGIENSDKRVGAIVTIPTKGELNSAIVKNNALKVLNTLSDQADNGTLAPFIIIDNEKARKMFSKLTVAQFYPTINATIAKLFTTFNVISTKKSDLISFDKADYKSIIFNANETAESNASSHMIFGAANISKDKLEIAFREDGHSGIGKCMSSAIRNNLESTLLASDFDLQTAKTVGAIIIGGQNLFDSIPGLMEGLEDAFSTISYLTGNATVHRGLYTDSSNGIKVFTIIGGLKRPLVRYRKLVNS